MRSETIPRDEKAIAGLSNTGKPISVLYLDDDDIDRMLMGMYVKRHLGNAVDLHLAETICEARDALASNCFDYFVTDNRMPPVRSYRETLDQLDMKDFEGRIIVVSSETRFECFDSQPDSRVHGVTDKSDLSKAIGDGLFGSY